MTLHAATVHSCDHESITVSGELDIATVPYLRTVIDPAVRRGPVPSVILDISDLTFMDSTGLGLILACHQAAEERGGRLVIVNPARQVHRLLAATKVDAHIPVFWSIDDALASWDVENA